MESQQTSQHRRPLLQDPERPCTVPTPPRRQPWRLIFGCSLGVCVLLLLTLTSLQQPSEARVRIQTISASTQYLHHELGDAGSVRPRIELHPVEHAHRPATTQAFEWRITKDDRRPDGVRKQVYLINGLFPGPTIEGRSGDTMVITVTNALQEEPVVIHWHGLHIANAMDGAAGISQCPIPPGGKFTYKFTIPLDQSGTFWYHGHSGVARADGLYGGLVVHRPASQVTAGRRLYRRHFSDLGGFDPDRYGYDKELLLLAGDWYHRSADDVLAWYMRPESSGNEPGPDSLLINGVGQFDCSMAVPSRPVDCIDQQLNTSFLDLDPAITYRIRVVNTGALTGLTLTFDREHLNLIQLDGVDVEHSPQEASNSVGILFPGQRMDFILHASKVSTGSALMVEVDEQNIKILNLVLTADQTFPIIYRGASGSNLNFSDTSLPSVRNHINIERVASSPSILQALPPSAQQMHVVYTKIQLMSWNHNVPTGYFNQTTWKPQQDPALPLIALPRSRWDSNQLSIVTGPQPVWVDLVINNLDEGSHPFHLHGHHFYVLTVQKPGFGWGSYNPFEDRVPPGFEDLTPPGSLSNTSLNDSDASQSSLQPFDLTRAIYRDTVQIPSRGYAVLRFRADNPGVWLLHCHVAWHAATGMGMLLDVQGDPTGLTAHDRSLVSLPGGGICSVP